MEKIEFYQRTARGHRKLSKIFLSPFFQILAMNVIKYFDLVVYFEKIINLIEFIFHGKNRILSKGHRKLSKIFYRHFFKL